MSRNPMEELAQLYRLQKYQKQKRQDIYDRLQRLQTSCELRRRILRNQFAIQGALADNLRTVNKSEFRLTHDSYKDVRELCETLHDGQNPRNPGLSQSSLEHNFRDADSFLSHVSSEACDTVLFFLSNVVSNADFLAERLLALQQQEIDNLAFLQRSSSSSQRSIFDNCGSHVRRQSSSIFVGAQDSKPSGQIWDACRHDGLSLLVELVGCYVPRDSTLSMAEQQEDMWATVCSRALIQKQAGSEKLVLAIFDSLSHHQEVSGHKGLESWLLETLQDGQFLLGRTEKPSFRMRTEPSTTENQLTTPRADAFYTRVIKKLFSTLKSNDRIGLIPLRTVRLGRSIVSKLGDSPDRARSVSLFFVARWLFSSFLMDHIITPESRGILLNYYFPETARHRILREVASRVQKHCFDVAYPWTRNPASVPEFQEEIESIAAMFRPSKQQNVGRDKDSHTGKPIFRGETQSYRSICVSDIVTLTDTLYPQRRPLSRASIYSVEPVDLRSPAASVSGVSLSLNTWQEVVQPVEFDVQSDTRSLSSDQDLPDTPRLSPAGDTKPGILPLRSLTPMADYDDAEHQGLRIRAACTEILHGMRNGPTSGHSNPALDLWELFDLSDGVVRPAADLGVTHRTSFAPGYESGSDPEDDGARPVDVEASYMDIRRAVFRLLQEQAFVEESDCFRLSPQPSTARLSDGTDVLSNPFRGMEDRKPRRTSNPFRTRSRISDTGPCVRPDMSGDMQKLSGHSAARSTSPSSLSACLEHAIEYFQRNDDFVKAFSYTQTLQRVSQLSSLGSDSHFPLVKHFIRDLQQALKRALTDITRFEGLIMILEQEIKGSDMPIWELDRNIEGLRIKMWYCADVRAAAPYEELQRVASALQAMTLPKQMPPEKIHPPLRHKTTLRPRNLAAGTRSGAAVMDIMAAEAGRGGPNKLSDSQVSVTKVWMQTDGIENLCQGEERIHRLACEMSKCINQLVGSDAVNNPVLWASELFQRDRIDGENEALRAELNRDDDRSSVSSNRPTSRGSEVGHSDRISSSMRRKSYFSIASVSMASNDSTHDYFEARSPTLTTRSSTTFWSPSGIGSQSPSSVTSMPSRAWSPKHLRQSISRESFQSATNVKTLMTALRQSVTNLLISDVFVTSFPAGSETDVSFWTAFDGSFARKHRPPPANNKSTLANNSMDSFVPKPHQKEAKSTPDVIVATPVGNSQSANSEHRQKVPEGMSLRKTEQPVIVFDLDRACKRLLRRFDRQTSPFAKMKALHDLEILLVAEASHHGDPTTHHRQPLPKSDDFPAVPAHIEHIKLRLDAASPTARKATRRDTAVREFQSLFRDPSLRPAGLFRDLQMIASLIPAEILDTTARGKSFWNASIAALSLKQEITQSMIETADAIIVQNTAHRGHSRGASSAAQQERDAAAFSPRAASASPSDVSNFSMQDAARLLTITAKEGDAVAQRELATLYLTHPELLDRVLPPLVRPRDVFKDSLLEKWRREGDDAAAAAAKRYDPLTMCVAHCWMESAARGGDVLARKYLQAQDEMERIP